MAVTYQDPNDTYAAQRAAAGGGDDTATSPYAPLQARSGNGNLDIPVNDPALTYESNVQNAVLQSEGINTSNDDWQNGLSTQQMGSIIGGAAEVGAEASDAKYNDETTWDKLSGDLALGLTVAAVGVAGGAMAPALAGALGGGTAGSIEAGTAIGAATGTADSAITGQPLGKGALLGALTGGIGAAAAPGVSALAGDTGIPNSVLSGVISKGIGAGVNAIAGGSPQTSGQTNMMGQGSITTPAQATANTGIGSAGVFGSSSNLGSFMSGIGGIAGTVLGGISSNNIAGMQQNAYTTAGNAANYGNNFGFNGLGGMGGTFSNGQLNLTGGAMNPAATQFSQFANNQGNMANMYSNGGVPSNVTSGFNTFNNQIGMGIGNANAGATAGMGVMNQGQQMLGSANANQTSAYNTALNSGLAALNPQIQQQSNALLNSNFERGMSGTSGGALQTQALQNSFNTADLQVQNNATTQGLNAFNSTINAGTSMFNSGAGQMGNFNNQGVGFGAQGMTGAMNYNSYSPTLAGQYQTNANNAVTGYGGINNQMLGNFQAGMAGVANQGNQMNAAARTQSGAANTYNGGLAGYASGVLGSPGASNNLLSGASSLFSGLTGLLGGGTTNFGLNQTGAASNIPGLESGAMSASAPDFNANSFTGIGSGFVPNSSYGFGGWDTGGI
jgi:hypothetical protein